MLYHQTKDVLYVMRFLRHRSIKNTLVYIQLEEALFQHEAEDYICKIADTVDEAKQCRPFRALVRRRAACSQG